jgi:hypothetical protein
LTACDAVDYTAAVNRISSLLLLPTLALAACVAPDLSSDEDLPLAAQSAALARSASPPGGLAVSQVPQFVAVTFDDNFSAEGVNWAVGLYNGLTNPAGSGQAATFDGVKAKTSFYHNSLYLQGNEASWGAAVGAGHETGDHTVNHTFGLGFNAQQWTDALVPCRDALAAGLGVPKAQIAGFRAPYLAYNDALYNVLAAQSPVFAYDTSIESGWGDAENGGNAPWPYTLDSGSADAASVVAKFGSTQAQPVGVHPGLWELPVTTLIVPPDSLAATYGFTPGLRARVKTALTGKAAPSFYEESTGKVGGLDITLIVDGAMNKVEALATLKYTLDLKLAGNRAPFVFVAHTHVYATGYGAAPNVQSYVDRRAILSEFLAYALSRSQVRVVSEAGLLAWMKAPVALGGGTCVPQCSGKTCGPNGCGGSCGTCAGGQSCNGSGVCVCTPQCSGKTCGPDGCGGTCGTCAGGQSCNGSGVCTGTCVPQCSGKTCGADGCGGSCGTCGSGQTCNTGGVCVCVPQCSGKTCGPNGCGGSCGTCGSGQTCSSAGACTGGSGDCSSPPWAAGTYAVGAKVTATCAASTAGTACYNKVGVKLAWSCGDAYWCGQLAPGGTQGGWWSAWASLTQCP